MVGTVEPVGGVRSSSDAVSTERTGRIPADVAHDLLGMLTVVRGYAELVAAESSQAVRETYCSSILRSCSKMAALVGDSLDLSRIESGGLVVKTESVRLAPFLRDCLATQNLKATRKGIDLHLKIAGTPTVWLDPACIERVLDNLLDNAIKYSRRGTTITLGATVGPGCMELDVHDRGQGIPPQEFSVIFEAFKMGTAEPTGGERSSGLGLAIVKKLVEAHHGEIRVRSEVGRGSTFSVRLPLPRAVPPAETQPAVLA